jgi:cold shock CspA family protein/ribosome-associated translation inhibitor RaiA
VAGRARLRQRGTKVERLNRGAVRGMRTVAEEVRHMAFPVQITFRDLPHSDRVAAVALRHCEKLETFHDRIVRCHVVLEAPHRHHRHGQRYHVRIDLLVPGKELVASRAAEDDAEDLYVLLEAAFADAARQLQDHASLLEVDTKAHHRPPHAHVARVFRDRGYGFLAAEDGHEVYFHENSVLGARFAELMPGAKVRYAEEDGDKGPQASTVHVVSTR